jgi:hypothetical protein
LALHRLRREKLGFVSLKARVLDELLSHVDLRTEYCCQAIPGRKLQGPDKIESTK